MKVKFRADALCHKLHFKEAGETHTVNLLNENLLFEWCKLSTSKLTNKKKKSLLAVIQERVGNVQLRYVQ